jgi:hypothetical protein
MPDKQDTQRDAKPVPDQVTVRGDAAALRDAADKLLAHKLNTSVRGFVIPTDAIAYSEAIDNGAISVLHAAGFVICSPGTVDPALAQGEIAMRVPETPLSDMIEAALAP